MLVSLDTLEGQAGAALSSALPAAAESWVCREALAVSGPASWKRCQPFLLVSHHLGHWLSLTQDTPFVSLFPVLASGQPFGKAAQMLA